MANLPHSRPTLQEEEQDDFMQEEEDCDDSDAEEPAAATKRGPVKYSPLERSTSFEEDRFHYMFRVREERRCMKVPLNYHFMNVKVAVLNAGTCARAAGVQAEDEPSGAARSRASPRVGRLPDEDESRVDGEVRIPA